MLTEGFKLMVAGMGTVFVFLALMILIINGLAKVLAPFAGVLEEKKDPRAKKNISKSDQKDNKAIITAIVSAVHQYRKDRGITTK
jgi:oxaloacetate decarboxylase (Na+ extruding) subunit gamma